MGCVRRVGGVVTWRRRWASFGASLAAGDVASSASSLALSLVSLGAGDVASLGVVVGVVGRRRWRRWVPVTWRRRESSLASLEASDVASFGGGVDEPAPDWPKCGQSPGGSTAAVAAAHGGGGG